MRQTFVSIMLALAALIGFTACEKERNEAGNDVVEGLPVNSIELALSSPSDDIVTVTRASAEVETNVQNMALLFYKANTNAKPIIIYVDKNGMGAPQMITQPGRAGSTNYKYKVDLDVAGKGITTGKWYLYAIANYDTKFCNIEMSEIEKLSRDEFLARRIDKANREPDIVENAVMMTGNYCESGNFGDDGSLTLEYDNKEEGSCKIGGVIHLRRIVAKISFEFRNGSNSETTGVTFTPETYSIHEYSRSFTLMERDFGSWTTTGGVTNVNGYAGNGIFASHEEGVSLAVIDNKMEFYMPENIQKAKASPTTWTYAERERRVSATDRAFEYAPEHGTYIVVKGQYKDSKYSGDVTYTIHLGDFSSANGNAYDNFSIRRNFHYSYTITVNGVNSIIVEAETGDNEIQPGAEGNLIHYNKEALNIRLDAHYENVLLKIKVPEGSNIINAYSVRLNTPYSKSILVTDKDLSVKDGADYDWIRFGKPADESSMKAYKASETTDIFSLLEELKGKTLDTDGDHYIVRGGYIYTTAYVNEYYYESKMNGASDMTAELKRFVNADDRTMTIAFGDIKVSHDKQSSYTDNVVFSIQQRSIKSFFDLNVNNPFGVEQVEETPEGAYNSNNTVNNDYNDSHHGYDNFKNAVGASWSTHIDGSSSVGYVVSSNSEITFNDNALKSTYGIYQCLSRNRDENGDGIIDGDEIKWYLPAVDQCTNYWFGMNSLPNEARIQMKVNEGSKNNYWNSTSGNATWWADEGSAYGAIYQTAKVRCIRSLKDYSAETTNLTSNNPDTRTVTISGLDEKSVRESNTVHTEYSEHFRGESVDKLPEALQIAKDFLSVRISDTETKTTFTKNELISGDWCQKHYKEDGDSDLGGWRIPNEKELAVINHYYPDPTNHTDLLTASKSKYARPGTNPTFFMVFYVNIYNQITTNPKYNTTKENDVEIGDNSVFKIRCVRDATPATTGADVTDNSSNSYGNGGIIIK